MPTKYKIRIDLKYIKLEKFGKYLHFKRYPFTQQQGIDKYMLDKLFWDMD